LKRSDNLIGHVLGGRYRVDARVGEGAHGAVFRGWHLALDLPVAIKVAYRSDGVLGERFRREARTLMKLSHPHVVRVYDYAREPDGRAYLVQEYITGRSLHALVETHGPLHPELVVEIGLQTLSALAATHARGIVHRDVKPANLMLTEVGDTPVVRLLDFGVAKLLDEEEGPELTRVGGVVGTPAFMAPEQVRGTVMPASDVYALGGVLHFLLSGHLLYDRQKSAEVLQAQLDEPPPPLPRSVPAPLAAVIERALQKSLDRRYRSADEMSAALRAAAVAMGRGVERVAVPSADDDPAPAAPKTPPPWAQGVSIGDPDRGFLGKLALFRGLSDGELAEVGGAIRRFTAPGGVRLFEVGEASDGAYIVASGELCAELVLPDGQTRAVARFGPGVVVGEIGLVESETRSLRVRVTADAALYHVDREQFTALRQRHHEGAYKVIRNIAVMLCDRLRDTNARIREQWQGRTTGAANLSGRLPTAEPRDIFGRLRRLFGMG
ncbi:MAG: protein kinase, partial [Myxococcales bacterium]|nr:protein kinase [Myxococcales bacterium]